MDNFNWSEDKIKKFRRTVLDWYDNNKRDLPWRHTRNPYYIWVSEIMAQQTQVGTVIPYYERFIAELPTIESLAKADEQTLMNLWQGLGYYSRVRNMQKAAQQVMERHKGEMPQTMAELLALQGIGPYTAAAIGSIAFNLIEPAIDGNLLRVTARLFELSDDIAQPKSRKVFEHILYELIDRERPGDFNQALMDIGATIMTSSNPTPHPHPLAEFDLSYQKGTSHLYPVKSKKTKATHHYMLAYAIVNEYGEYLYRKHKEHELLTGLWHFPLIEQEIVMESATSQELLEPLMMWLENSDIDEGEVVQLEFDRMHYHIIPPYVKHIFSHRVWHVNVIEVHCSQRMSFSCEDYQWIKLSDLSQFPISTLQQKIQRTLWEDIT